MADTLRIYDIVLDNWRDATQADIDKLGAVARAYGQLRAAVETVHAELQADVRRIQSQAGLPA